MTLTSNESTSEPQICGLEHDPWEIFISQPDRVWNHLERLYLDDTENIINNNKGSDEVLFDLLMIIRPKYFIKITKNSPKKIRILMTLNN